MMVTALCCTAWKKIFEVWELCNAHVHGHDAVTAAAATKKQLFTKIKLLHSRQNEALEHDHQTRPPIFNPGSPQLLPNCYPYNNAKLAQHVQTPSFGKLCDLRNKSSGKH
jgi:hypothetical protein